MLAKKTQRKEEKRKHPIKCLFRINICVCFFLYRGKNEKEGEKCIVQRDEKKTCLKVIQP
jgi:hypothetical protein